MTESESACPNASEVMLAPKIPTKSLKRGQPNWQVVTADVRTHRPRAAAGEVAMAEDRVRSAEVASAAGAGVRAVIKGYHPALGHPVRQ